MTDKLKEAAEKYAPAEFTNCGGPMRSAFIAGATSPEAEEYWRGKMETDLLKWLNEKDLLKDYVFCNQHPEPDRVFLLTEILAMFRKEKDNG